METISELPALFAVVLIGSASVIGVFALGVRIGSVESAEAHEWLWRLIRAQEAQIVELNKRLRIAVNKANEARAELWRDRSEEIETEDAIID